MTSRDAARLTSIGTAPSASCHAAHTTREGRWSGAWESASGDATHHLARGDVVEREVGERDHEAEAQRGGHRVLLLLQLAQQAAQVADRLLEEQRRAPQRLCREADECVGRELPRLVGPSALRGAVQLAQQQRRRAYL